MCEHFSFELTEDDRYYVRSKENNNCTFCLVDKESPMTQSQIAEYMSISVMRVCQIEHQALKKLRKQLLKNNIRFDDFISQFNEFDVSSPCEKIYYGNRRILNLVKIN